MQQNEIYLTDEFYEETIPVNLKECSVLAFIDKVWFNLKYIHPADKSILFTIEWDSFFLPDRSRRTTHETNSWDSFIPGFFL